MRKYVIIEIKSEKTTLKDYLNLFWFLSREALVFLGCIGLAILMFSS